MHLERLILMAILAAIFFLPETSFAGSWALFVGIDEYSDYGEFTPLIGASNDALSLSQTVQDIFDIPDKNLFVLTSRHGHEQPPTRENILKSLKYVRDNARPDDVFIFGFSGHGIASENVDFLLTYHSRAAAVSQTALSLDWVRQIIQDIPAQKKILLIDACRNDPLPSKGVERNVLRESFARSIAIRAVADHQESVAATLFSCSFGERSYEWPDKRRGFFSYFVEQGLRGAAANQEGAVTLGNLIRHVQELVPPTLHNALGDDKSQNPYVILEGHDPASWVMNGGRTLPPLAVDDDELQIRDQGVRIIDPIRGYEDPLPDPIAR